MNIGVSTASYYPLETENALEEIGKSGIKTTEIFFNCESELKPAFVDILKSIQDEYDINITAIHPTLSLAEPFMIFSAYERRFNESIQKFARYSEVAAELGAKYIIMHGGKPNGILNDEEYCQRYMILKETALKNGVTILQENVCKFCSGDVEFLRSMCDILGDDAEFCFDIKQAIRSGLIPMEVVSEFISHIKHFHISDHSIASDCMLPGNGGFNFEELFRFLKKQDFKGALNIEVYRNAYKDFEEINNSFKGITQICKKI